MSGRTISRDVIHGKNMIECIMFPRFEHRFVASSMGKKGNPFSPVLLLGQPKKKL